MGLFETLFRACNQGGFDQHHYLQSNTENTALNFESGRWREGVRRVSTRQANQ
jgi:hypothetical protein